MLRFRGRICIPDNEEMKKMILEESHRSSLSIHPVGTKGVSQIYHLSFDDNKVLKIINWIC